MKILEEIKNEPRITDWDTKQTVKTGGNHDYDLYFNRYFVLAETIDGSFRLYLHDNNFIDADTQEPDYEAMAWELFDALTVFEDKTVRTLDVDDDMIRMDEDDVNFTRIGLEMLIAEETTYLEKWIEPNPPSRDSDMFGYQIDKIRRINELRHRISMIQILRKEIKNK